MLHLDDLPSEVLVAIAGSLHEFEPHQGMVKPNLLNLALACRRIHYAINSCLYEKFIYHGAKDYNGHYLRRYILSLLDRYPGQEVREIVLRDWYWSPLDEIWLALDLATNSKICSPDTFGSSLCRISTHLRKLTIDYPPHGDFLNIHSPTIQELCVRPAHCPWSHTPGDQATIDFPIDGPLRVDFLPYVLKWPRLKCLSLEATTIYGDQSLYDSTMPVQPRSSPITNLKLRLGNFDGKALSQLCGALTALKIFTYLPTLENDVADHASMAILAHTLRGFSYEAPKSQDCPRNYLNWVAGFRLLVTLILNTE